MIVGVIYMLKRNAHGMGDHAKRGVGEQVALRNKQHSLQAAM
jgi:hypothetical protein